MATLSQIDAEMALARSALKSGDYATALACAISAQGMLSVTPDTQKGDLHVGFARRSGEIEAFVANVRKPGCHAHARGGHVECFTENCAWPSKLGHGMRR